jgi:hypothetical protein
MRENSEVVSLSNERRENSSGVDDIQWELRKSAMRVYRKRRDKQNESSAPMQRPSFGHENQRFRENQPKTLVFIPNLAQRRHFQLVLKR